MLDKSLPYFDVVMCLPEGTALPETPPLPEGYAYTLYAPGDEAGWCATEAAVDEFDDEAQAMEYFRVEFAPHPKELPRRMVFIRDPQGVPVANAAAWWRMDDTRGRVPMLHWVAVKPSQQGLGLGRAVTLRALSRFADTKDKGDIWLTTQTWSHVAIDLYVDIGFRAHKTAIIAKHKNGFAGAAKVLEGVMRPKTYAKMMYTALQ